MGYFKSVLRQTGLLGKPALAARRSGVAPIERDEFRVVAPVAAESRSPVATAPPAPRAAQSVAAASHSTPVPAPATTGKTGGVPPLAPPQAAPPPMTVIRREVVEQRPAPIEERAAQVIVEHHDRVEVRREVEVEERWQPIAAPAPDPKRPAAPRPAITIEEVRKWVAAPLVEKAQPAEVNAPLEVNETVEGQPWIQPVSRRAGIEPQLRTENYTLSIGSIQVIVEEPAQAAPKPASATAAAPRASSPVSLDSTRLQRHYISF